MGKDFEIKIKGSGGAQAAEELKKVESAAEATTGSLRKLNTSAKEGAAPFDATTAAQERLAERLKTAAGTITTSTQQIVAQKRILTSNTSPGAGATPYASGLAPQSAPTTSGTFAGGVAGGAAFGAISTTGIGLTIAAAGAVLKYAQAVDAAGEAAFVARQKSAQFNQDLRDGIATNAGGAITTTTGHIRTLTNEIDALDRRWAATKFLSGIKGAIGLESDNETRDQKQAEKAELIRTQAEATTELIAQMGKESAILDVLIAGNTEKAAIMARDLRDSKERAALAQQVKALPDEAEKLKAFKALNEQQAKRETLEKQQAQEAQARRDNAADDEIEQQRAKMRQQQIAQDAQLLGASEASALAALEEAGLLDEAALLRDQITLRERLLAIQKQQAELAITPQAADALRNAAREEFEAGIKKRQREGDAAFEKERQRAEREADADARKLAEWQKQLAAARDEVAVQAQIVAGHKDAAKALEIERRLAERIAQIKANAPAALQAELIGLEKKTAELRKQEIAQDAANKKAGQAIKDFNDRIDKGKARAEMGGQAQAEEDRANQRARQKETAAVQREVNRQANDRQNDPNLAPSKRTMSDAERAELAQNIREARSAKNRPLKNPQEVAAGINPNANKGGEEAGGAVGKLGTDIASAIKAAAEQSAGALQGAAAELQQKLASVATAITGIDIQPILSAIEVLKARIDSVRSST